MIEEPYRWVEAIANRREYIETQLAPGSPIAALSCRDGILFVTVGRGRQKLFEIYASPYFQARAESLHGYDITDHNKLNDVRSLAPDALRSST